MSRLPFELQLALRYLRPKRTFVSVITLISIIGVTLGVAVLIIVISVMTGFDRQLREKILGFNAHLKVSRMEGTLRDYAKVMSQIESNPEVRGTAPFVLGPVFLEVPSTDGGSRVWPPYLRGIEPALESKVSVLGPKTIVDGKFDVSGNGLLIGRDLAASLGAEVGEIVNILSPVHIRKMWKQRGKENEEAILPIEYKVTG